MRARLLAATLGCFLLPATALAQAQKPPVVSLPASPANYSAQRRAPSLIVIHKAEGSGASAASWFQNPAAQASAHYAVDYDGTIYQSVPDDLVAWHTGNHDYNVAAIGVEHGGMTVAADVTEDEYRASARLVAAVCAAYKIPIDRGHIIGHNEVPDPNHPGEFGGSNHHQDPGPYWDWNHYMALVKDAAGQATAPQGAAPGSGIGLAPTPDGQGYWIAKNDGGVFSYGTAQFHGSAGNLRLNAPVVAIAARPQGDGYWLVCGDGGLFAFGAAPFLGSLGALHLNAPIVGMAAAPDGLGYWLVAADGGVFCFGTAGFHGSLGALALNAPIVGIAAAPDGQGYWLVAADGGVFCFGTAGFHGSLGALHLNAPIVGIAATPDGQGYDLVAADGGVFCFGSAIFAGSAGGTPLNQPIGGIAVTGAGYRLVAWDGGIFCFGGAIFAGAGV